MIINRGRLGFFGAPMVNVPIVGQIDCGNLEVEINKVIPKGYPGHDEAVAKARELCASASRITGGGAGTSRNIAAGRVKTLAEARTVIVTATEAEVQQSNCLLGNANPNFCGAFAYGSINDPTLSFLADGSESSEAAVANVILNYIRTGSSGTDQRPGGAANIRPDEEGPTGSRTSGPGIEKGGPATSKPMSTTTLALLGVGAFAVVAMLMKGRK